MQNKVISVVSIISGVIAALSLIYNTFLKGTYNRKRKYYNGILKPFIEKYKANRNINSIKFIKKISNCTDDEIPKYIFYLIQNGEEEILQEVLIYDYCKFYKNDDNNFLSIFGMFCRVSYYLFSFLFVLLFLMGTMLFTLMCSVFIFVLYNFFVYKTVLVNLETVLLYVLLIVIAFVSAFAFNWIGKSCNDDIYTIKVKSIKKLIKIRTEWYEKCSNNVVL